MPISRLRSEFTQGEPAYVLEDVQPADRPRRVSELRPALRVGCVIDGGRVPAYQQRLIRAIADEPGLTVTLIVARPPEAGRRPPLLATLHDRVDRFVNRHWVAPVLAGRDVAAALRGFAIIDLTTADARQATTLLGDIGIDVLLRLGRSALDPEIVSSSRCGAWSFRLGSGALPECLAEHVRDDTAIECVLLVESAGDSPRVIDRSRVSLHEFSPSRSRALIHAGSRAMLLRHLRDLRDTGDAGRWMGRPIEPARVDPPPDDADIVPFLARYAFRSARKLAQWSMFDIYHWRVAVGLRPPGMPLVDCPSAADLHIIEAQVDTFHADPFLLEHEGATWVFFEEFRYAHGRGRIVAAKLDQEGRAGPLVTVLDEPTHLSYPFTFRHRGELYMIPQTEQRHRVELYRCERFPDRWVLDRVLLDGLRAIDASLLEHEGRLWLFAEVADDRGAAPRLHLYFADDLDGPFVAHPLNPIVSDSRCSRPGGRIFLENGRLVRPGQDCEGRYGRALWLQRIRTLSPTAYGEEPMGTVQPEDARWLPGALGTHTLDATARYCATDACVSRFRGRRWLSRVAGWPTRR